MMFADAAGFELIMTGMYGKILPDARRFAEYIIL